MVSRRALLLAAPAVALSACGKAAEEPAEENPNVDTGTQKQGDIALLTGLLDEEAKDAPFAGSDDTPLGQFALARSLEREASRNRRAFQTAVKALGGRVPGTRFPEFAPFDAAGAATAVEASIRLYLDFIPKLSDGRVRKLVAGVYAVKAERLAELRIVLDQPPVPEAFIA